MGTPKVAICDTCNFFASRHRQLVIAFEQRVFIELGLCYILEALLGVIDSEGILIWSATTDAPSMSRSEPMRDFLEIRILKAFINGAFLTQDSHGID